MNYSEQRKKMEVRMNRELKKLEKREAKALSEKKKKKASPSEKIGSLI